MNFIKRITTGKASAKVEIHLVRGKSPEGNPTYAYLAIYAHRVRDFLLSLKTRHTSLKDYGVVIASGEGEPDEATKHYIQKTYSLSKNMDTDGDPV
jgi:hypothetical protein